MNLLKICLMRLTRFYNRKETKLTTPDYSHQATISGLHSQIDNLNKQITEFVRIDEANKTLIQQLQDRATANYNALSDLQYAIKYFFEANRVDKDNFEFDIDEVNKFLTENGMDSLKREYRVSFSIEGVYIVEAESEDEAAAIAEELDVSHYTADIEYFNATADSVDTTF